MIFFIWMLTNMHIDEEAEAGMKRSSEDLKPRSFLIIRDMKIVHSSASSQLKKPSDQR